MLIVLALRVPESRDDSADRKIDIVGATLATLGLGLLVYGLIEMNGARITLAAAGVALLGLASLAAFVLFERRTPDPMVRCDLFASRAFSVANVYTFFLYGALGGSLYFVPFVLINVHHYSPSAAGAALLPFIFIMVVSSRFSGRTRREDRPAHAARVWGDPGGRSAFSRTRCPEAAARIGRPSFRPPSCSDWAARCSWRR